MNSGTTNGVLQTLRKRTVRRLFAGGNSSGQIQGRLSKPKWQSRQLLCSKAGLMRPKRYFDHYSSDNGASWATKIP